jgi:hypothetical protein
VVQGNEWYAAGGVMKNGTIRGLVTRLGATGAYDPTWAGGTGYDEPTSPGEKSEFTRIVAQSDGKVLVAGTWSNSATTQALAVGRVRNDGMFDVFTFNVIWGWRTIDFQMPGNFDLGAALALQAGRPVVAGSVEAVDNSGDYDFGVARFENDLIFASRFGKTAED